MNSENKGVKGLASKFQQQPPANQQPPKRQSPPTLPGGTPPASRDAKSSEPVVGSADQGQQKGGFMKSFTRLAGRNKVKELQAQMTIPGTPAKAPQNEPGKIGSLPTSGGNVRVIQPMPSTSGTAVTGRKSPPKNEEGAQDQQSGTKLQERPAKDFTPTDSRPMYDGKYDSNGAPSVVPPPPAPVVSSAPVIKASKASKNIGDAIKSRIDLNQENDDLPDTTNQHEGKLLDLDDVFSVPSEKPAEDQGLLGKWFGLGKKEKVLPPALEPQQVPVVEEKKEDLQTPPPVPSEVPSATKNVAANTISNKSVEVKKSAEKEETVEEQVDEGSTPRWVNMFNQGEKKKKSKSKSKELEETSATSRTKTPTNVQTPVYLQDLDKPWTMEDTVNDLYSGMSDKLRKEIAELWGLDTSGAFGEGIKNKVASALKDNDFDAMLQCLDEMSGSDAAKNNKKIQEKISNTKKATQGAKGLLSKKTSRGSLKKSGDALLSQLEKPSLQPLGMESENTLSEEEYSKMQNSSKVKKASSVLSRRDSIGKINNPTLKTLSGSIDYKKWMEGVFLDWSEEDSEHLLKVYTETNDITEDIIRHQIRYRSIQLEELFRRHPDAKNSITNDNIKIATTQQWLRQIESALADKKHNIPAGIQSKFTKIAQQAMGEVSQNRRSWVNTKQFMAVTGMTGWILCANQVILGETLTAPIMEMAIWNKINILTNGQTMAYLMVAIVVLGFMGVLLDLWKDMKQREKDNGLNICLHVV